MRDRQRLRWIGVWMAVLLAGVAASAADDPAVSSLDYWPREPGATWVYANEQGRQQVVVRVVGQERLDDETATVIERGASGAAPVFRSYYVVRDSQVLLVAQQKVGEPTHRLPAPMVVWPATSAMRTLRRLNPRIRQLKQG